MNPTSILISLVTTITIAVSAFLFGSNTTEHKYKAIIANMELSSQKALSDATIRVLDLERQMKSLQEDQNDKDILNIKSTNNLHATIATMQLRDKHATPSVCSPTTTTVATEAADSQGQSSTTGQLLSEPLTRLLQTITLKADAQNNAYISCDRQLDIDRTINGSPETSQ